MKCQGICAVVLAFLAFLVSNAIGANNAVEILSNCGLSIPYASGRPAFEFNVDLNRWDLAEVQLYERSGNGEVFLRAINGFPTNLAVREYYDFDINLNVVFIYNDASRSCAALHFGFSHSSYRRFECPDGIYQIPCPLSSTKAVSKPNQCSEDNLCGDENQWHCASGDCVFQGPWAPTACKDLYRRDFFPFRVASPSHLQLGFRLTDCQGSMLSTLSANDLVIREGNINLLPIETKQQLIKIEVNENFVQLMISMCPRTLLVLEDLIAGLHNFLTQLDLSTSRVALTVFDGARGYVDLVMFTQDENVLRESFEQLRNYTLRDESCNIKESLLAKFDLLSSYLFGLEWDRVHFVVFTASADVVNFVTDDAITIPVSKADIATYLIGWNIPSAQEDLMRAIGRAAYVNTDDASMIADYFTTVAQQVSLPLASDYIVGYCSPARTGVIDAMVSWNISGSIVRLQGLSYNASAFSSGCNAKSLLDYCKPRTTNLEDGIVICYEAFNSSSASVPRGRRFVQVLLRYPSEEDVLLQLPFSAARPTSNFEVYIRKGGIANPLLYDMKYSNVSATSIINLNESFVAGDLVGVHVDFKYFSYDETKLIRIAPLSVEPPVQPPTKVPVNPSAPSVNQTRPVGSNPTIAPTSNDQSPVSMAVPIDTNSPAEAGVVSSALQYSVSGLCTVFLCAIFFST